MTNGMKADEAELVKALQNTPPNVALAPFEAGQMLGIPEKRLMYIFKKWTGRGWFESGVSTRTGWLTRAGADVFESQL